MSTTTLEQSRHLIELGLNINTADSYWQHISDNDNGKDFWKLEYIQLYWKPIVNLPDTYVYAWSLDSLINLGRKIKGVTDFNLNMCLEYGWYLEFRGYDKNKNHGLLHESFATEPIDAAYDMVCWLLENKYI